VFSTPSSSVSAPSAGCAPLTGMLHLGAYPADGADAELERVLDAVAADLEGARLLAPRPPEVMTWKRAKLLSNLGNAPDALFPRGGWDDLVQQARDEALAVFEAAGWEVTPAEEESAVRGDRMAPQDIEGRPRTGGSTYQSLARGAGSVETDYLNGEVAALGRLHRVPTPVNAALQQLAARAVRDGVPARSLSVDALRALL